MLLTVLAGLAALTGHAQTVARTWNEENLAAIRIDFPHPPAHARNLFHLSTAMYDAWAAYQTNAVGYVYHRRESAVDVPAARREAISYAAYGILANRYALSVNAEDILASLTNRMAVLGYDPGVTTTNGPSPAAVGNRIAAEIIAFALEDSSHQTYIPPYSDPLYQPVNDPLILEFSGTTDMNNPNRWQPLAFKFRVTQNGLEADLIQEFLGSHWGPVTPFGMSLPEGETVFFDPGPPPLLGGLDDDGYKQGSVEVVRFSSLLDPDSGIMIHIDPGHLGNNTLGQNDGTGHGLNPSTGEPYATNTVPLGDYGRVVAEFWADGPDSETPPGHWNKLANETVMDHPDFERRFMGIGPPLDPLEWDVKMYFALNAALHNAAITAWGCKAKYDYARPISSIRYLAEQGQSSHPAEPSFNTNGIPLVSNLVEVVTTASAAEGQRHEGMAPGQIAIYAWGGEPDNPETQVTGAKWFRAVDWMPYQRNTFVTPAFAGYVSGHSAFSRAAAEVLAAITGDPYFPGGMGTFTAHQNAYLEFEMGPSVTVVLQWATYFDASDEAGISRLYGGIHVPADDGTGRIMGSYAGLAAWAEALQYFDGSILNRETTMDIARNSDGSLRLSWSAIRGMHYQLRSGTNPGTLSTVLNHGPSQETELVFDVDPSEPPGSTAAEFFGVQRSLLP